MKRRTRVIDYLMKRGEFLFCMLVASLISLVIVVTLPVDSTHALIKVEPFLYMLFLVLFLRKETLHGPGSYILTVLYFLKMCIMPILNIKGMFFTEIALSVYEKNWNLACILIAGEWLICTLCMFLNSKFKFIFPRGSQNKKAIAPPRTVNKVTVANYPIIYFGMMVFVTVTVICLLIKPVLINQFFFFWDSEGEVLASSNPSSVYYLFKWTLERGRILLLLWLTVVLAQKRKRSTNILLLLIIVMSAVICTEYRMMGILVAGTSLLYYMINRESQKMSGLIRVLIIMGMVGVLYVTFGTNAINSTWRVIARTIDRYFAGYMTTAGALGCRIPNGFTTLIKSIYNQSTIASGLFGRFMEDCDVFLYSYLNPEAHGVFYEMSAQTLETLGIFAPIGIALLVKLILRMDEKFLTDQDPLYAIIYLFISVSNSVFFVMYTFSMNISHVLYYDCILLLLIYLNKRIKI